VLRRLGVVLTVVVAAAGVIGAGIPVCPSATLLHVPCPGCGMTRAMFAAFRGHFAESWHYHPLALVAVPLLLAYAAAHGAAYVRAGDMRNVRWWPGRWADRVLMGLMVAMIGLWAARFLGALGGPAPVSDTGLLASWLKGR
jgi:hypothetical protein